jgi:hypothetical protein
MIVVASASKGLARIYLNFSVFLFILISNSRRMPMLRLPYVERRKPKER